MRKIRSIYIDSSIEFGHILKKYLEKDVSIHVKLTNDLNDSLDKLTDIEQIILLIKLHKPGKAKIENINMLRKNFPNLLCLLLIPENDGEPMFEVLNLGVNGLVFENSALCVIKDSIQQVLNGGMPITSDLTRQMYISWQKKSSPDGLCLQQLSGREQEIIGQLSKGYLYKEIADHLNISILTVKNHLKKIYRKLSVSNRSEAIVKFLGK
jgi:two-component system, NarL family, response regulator LiaR